MKRRQASFELLNLDESDLGVISLADHYKNLFEMNSTNEWECALQRMNG